MFTENQIDHLKEIINIGIGRSANQLNKIVKNRVTLAVPRVLIIEPGKIKSLPHDINDNLSIISMNFKGELFGKVELMLSTENAVKIVDMLTDQSDPNIEMNELRTATLSEVGNIVQFSYWNCSKYV